MGGRWYCYRSQGDHNTNPGNSIVVRVTGRETARLRGTRGRSRPSELQCICGTLSVWSEAFSTILYSISFPLQYRRRVISYDCTVIIYRYVVIVTNTRDFV